jgi:hypothetical protein
MIWTQAVAVAVAKVCNTHLMEIYFFCKYYGFKNNSTNGNECAIIVGMTQFPAVHKTATMTLQTIGMKASVANYEGYGI